MSEVKVVDRRRLRVLPPARHCSACCEDMDIRLRDLLLPEAMMDADGLHFADAHGLRELRAKNGRIKFLLHGIVFELNILELMFPEVYLNAEGLKFFEEYNLRQAVIDNDMVKLYHVCDKLDTETGLCTIYDIRPEICRDFDCSTREDCTNA